MSNNTNNNNNLHQSVQLAVSNIILNSPTRLPVPLLPNFKATTTPTINKSSSINSSLSDCNNSNFNNKQNSQIDEHIYQNPNFHHQDSSFDNIDKQV